MGSVLLLSGTDIPAGVNVLRVLQCGCRHPLMLTDISRTAIRALPMSLGLTLLINQPEVSGATMRLLRDSNHRGVQVLTRGGEIQDLACAKAFFAGTNGLLRQLGKQAVHIAVPRGDRVQVLNDQQLQSLTARLQEAFLGYRLENATRIRDSAWQSVSTNPESASALLSCLPTGPGASGAMEALLASLQQDAKAEAYCDVLDVLVEVIWIELHDAARKPTREQKISVQKLTDGVNAMLLLRGDRTEFNQLEIGWKLKALGIPRRKSGPGMVVRFSQEVSLEVHRLARDMGLNVITQPETCIDCKKA